MRGLIATAGNRAICQEGLEVPPLRPGYILVRIVCVALNPCDAKSIFDDDTTIGCLIGTDYAGVVESTGHGYSKDWHEKERICGFARGTNVTQPRDGTFAEFAVVKADLQYRIPDNMSFEAAASLGVGLQTAAMGLFHKLALKYDGSIGEDHVSKDPAGEYVFIYGGSSSTGAMAIQLARMAGYKPITTCSPHNFSLVESRGAICAFDHKDPKFVQKILSWTGGRLSTAFDAMSTVESAEACAALLLDHPKSRYCSTLPLMEPFRSRRVQVKQLLLWSGLGEPVANFLGHYHPAVEADENFLRDWTCTAEDLLQEDLIKPHPIEVHSGGLDAIPEGLSRLHGGHVSGVKMIYCV